MSLFLLALFYVLLSKSLCHLQTWRFLSISLYYHLKYFKELILRSSVGDSYLLYVSIWLPFFFFNLYTYFPETEFLRVYLYKTWSKIFENLLNSDIYFCVYIIVSKNKTVEAKVCCEFNEFSSWLSSLLPPFLLPYSFWFVNQE